MVAMMMVAFVTMTTMGAGCGGECEKEEARYKGEGKEAFHMFMKHHSRSRLQRMGDFFAIKLWRGRFLQ